MPIFFFCFLFLDLFAKWDGSLYHLEDKSEKKKLKIKNKKGKFSCLASSLFNMRLMSFLLS